MSRLRTVLVFCLLGFGLSGCVTAGVTLAMSAVSMVSNSGGGGKQAPFKNPIDKHSTGRQVREALSRLDDRVDPACQQLLDQHKESGPMSASAASSMLANAPDIAPPNAAEGSKADRTTASDAADSPGTAASASSTAGTDGQSARSGVQMASASQSKIEGEGIGGGPGICQHRLVCLPGTPKPTMMLMCPGRNGAGSGADKAEKTVISSSKPDATPIEPSADEPAKGEKTVVSSGKPDATPIEPSADEPAKGEKTVASSGKPDTTPVAPAADKPAKGDNTVLSSSMLDPAPAEPSAEKPVTGDKTVISSSKPDPTPVKPAAEAPARGGVADWDWSQDPSKRL